MAENQKWGILEMESNTCQQIKELIRIYLSPSLNKDGEIINLLKIDKINDYNGDYHYIYMYVLYISNNTKF